MKQPYIWQVMYSLRAGIAGHIIGAGVDVWSDQYAPLCGAHLKGPVQLHHLMEPDCKTCLRRLHEMESHDPGYTRREDPSHRIFPGSNA